MAAVTLAHLTKRFGTLTALDDLSLDIADGEFIVLLGPSGCGKTTTMRMIAGLETPTEGDILIDGARVNDKPARQRDLAMVFQNYGLYPHMTVAENIGYPLKVRRVPVPQRQERVRQAAARVELGELLHRRPAELSGGQRQRVALARAIVRTPRLFLMDEPLSNLDAKLRSSMRAELKHLQRELGTTTIYVTHDQVEAMTLADRVVVLNKARLQQTGRPNEIYARPANTFVAGFIGSPPMNLVQGTIEAGGFVHAAGRIVGVAGPAGPVIFGQRPEDLAVVPAGEGELRGEVYSSELLGDSVLVTIRAGSDMLVAKQGPGSERAMGEPVGIRFSPDRIHLFDAETGARLETGR